MLKSICYKSTCKSHLSIIDQQGLIETLKKNYTELGITGVLVMKNQTCFQIIEGEDYILNDIYNQVRRDLRHKNLVEIINHTIKKPLFKGFYAGYCLTDDINSLYGIHKYLYFLEEHPTTNEDLFYDIIENLLLRSA